MKLPETTPHLKKDAFVQFSQIKPDSEEILLTGRTFEGKLLDDLTIGKPVPFLSRHLVAGRKIITNIFADHQGVKFSTTHTTYLVTSYQPAL